MGGFISMLRTPKMLDILRNSARKMFSVLVANPTEYRDDAFLSDLEVFVDLTDVQTLSDTSVSKCVEYVTAVKGGGNGASRFAKALRLFPTGQDLISLVLEVRTRNLSISTGRGSPF